MKKVILSGRSNLELAQKIARNLGLKLGNIKISNFTDGEINIHVQEDLKDKEVFIIQSTSQPVNDNLFELFLIADAARRSQAKNINLVMPYFGYSRKEKMSRSGEPISAKVVASFIESIGINKVIAFDLHSPVLQGFFNIPVINIDSTNLLISEFKKMKTSDLVVVSPDLGGTKRARNYASLLNAPVAIIEKHRLAEQNDKIKILNLIGQVKDKNVLIVDDLISTGATIAKAIDLLKEQGAKKVFVAISHLVLPNKAKETFENLPVEKIITTDSVYIKKEDQFPNLKIVSLSQELTKQIK